MDVEVGALGWARSVTDDRQPSTDDETQKTAVTTSPKRSKKFENRQTRSDAPCASGE